MAWQIIIIPLLILAINRMVYHWHIERILPYGDNPGLNFWVFYAILLAISGPFTAFTTYAWLLYLPMTYLVTAWVMQEHNDYLLKVLRRIRN